MQRQATTPEKIPLPLEPARPVAHAMDFIKEQNSLSASRSVLSFSPATFPEAGKRRIGLVTGSIYSGLAELSRDLRSRVVLPT